MGVLESFFATGVGGDVIPSCSDLSFLITPSDFASDLPKCSFSQKGGGGDVKIKHPETLNLDSRDARTAFHSWLIDLFAQIITRFFFVPNLEDYITRLARDELGAGRAVMTSDIDISIRNVLGQSPRLSLVDWKSDEHMDRRFPLLRKSPWNEGLKETGDKAGGIPIGQKTDAVPASDESSGLDKLEHRNVRFFSLINQSLWDKAGWNGTAYIIFEDPKRPPCMALGFTNAEVGQAIFEEWHVTVGKIDSDEKLRVSIITGIDKKKPFSYRVVIGVNPQLKDSQSKFMITASRISRMDPSTNTNLSNFLERYKRIGWYVLLPGHLKDGTTFSEPFWKYGISTRKLMIRPAWQISENDPDAVGLQSDDEPIIPEGIDDPYP